MPTWVSQEINITKAIVASQTNEPVSSNIKLADPSRMAVDITCSSIAITNSLVAKLQDGNGPVGAVETWFTKGSEANVTITATAEVQTLTCDTKANTVDGDYFVVTDTNGLDWAIAFDTTGGSSNTPTGAIWAAIPAGRRDEADISADTTAAQVAARVETAIDALTNFSAVITSDDTAANGTMTFTAVVAGPNMAAGQVLAKDDTSATTPALALADTTAPVSTGTFSFNLKVENSSDQAELPLRKLARLVVTSGVGDSVTVDSVRVCYFV